uniref:NADH-ubiquinone oxidoreductase chain 6 n=1 Tax=Hygrobia hermanni TaxID=107881 RepID=A0A191ZRJ5_9COLE|nr:NADH dehydrogenase subunit 6 [Hygrobia hermanni]ANJ70490.1 NADH dehydrogenase subunit 6 [Hygrobia hermanni]
MLCIYFMLIMFNFTMSMIFIFLNHPLSMGMILLIQTVIICLMTGFFSLSFWFSYIMFLIMLGGMLVLFIYMTSLASNEMFHFSKKIITSIIMIMLLFIIIYMMNDYMMIIPTFKNSNMMELLNNNLLMKNENMISLSKIYNTPNNLITIILINYLLLTLIAVVKIINVKFGPLRQKF